MGWRLWLLRPGVGGLPWARGPGPLERWGPLGWPRIRRRGWSRANPNVVSPRGRGCSRGTHDNTALRGSRGSHGGGGRSSWARSGGGSCWGRGDGGSSWARAVGRERGGTAHPGPESASSTGFHHTRA